MLGEITGNTKLWELGQRWETIEEAVSQQGKERSEDLSFLKEKLRQKAKMCYSIEIAKNEVLYNQSRLFRRVYKVANESLKNVSYVLTISQIPKIISKTNIFYR